MKFLNKINIFADNLLKIGEPKVFSIDEEHNIGTKINENLIMTRDGNMAIGFEMLGTSYSALNLEEEIQHLNQRISFFNKISNQIEINILTQKSISKNIYANLESSNIYANTITNKWGGNTINFEIRYFLIISTINKTITGAMESFKDKATTEKRKNLTKEEEKILSKEQKIKAINEISTNIFNTLGNYKPRLLTSDDLINLYATYANANETNLKYTQEILSDSFLNSEVDFKKDYIHFITNDREEVFSRFISIKAYETDSIKSAITTQLLELPLEYMVFLHTKAYSKEKAIKKIKDTAAFMQEIVRQELFELLELVKADRENLIETSYSVYLKAKSLEELDFNTNEIVKVLKNQGLSVTPETLNQKALYFSFYPARGNLNARKKTLKTSNLATLCTFEKEVKGFNKNDWGLGAIAQFKHLDGTPFLFNFHSQENGDRPAGHTMIIGGTGNGKTTLAQFLMCNLFKYDIDIFSMDKLRGMYNFTEFCDGQYHDSESDGFKLNPFSLPYTQENREFLQSWLEFMANIKEDEHELKEHIGLTIKRLYENTSVEQVKTLSDFIQSLPASDNNLKIRFNNFKESIFNNKEDALNFEKQLSILNMDGVLQNPKTSALTALYIFHKLKNQAKNNINKRGFFCFIDELKDYLNDDVMREKILEAILEVRKIGGVMCMGFQSISMFKGIPKGTAFLGNIANYIIFPTNNQNTIEELQELIGLTPTEARFLYETDPNARKILLKMLLRNETAYLDVDLSKLGNYLKAFSSSSDNVALLKKFKAENPQKWRELYLNYK